MERTKLITILYFITLAIGISHLAVADDANGKWMFSLSKGQNENVCKAYLARLNSKIQNELPFCGRPETGEELGFTLQNRIPLSQQAAFELLQRISGFTRSKNQDYYDIANATETRLNRKPNYPIQFEKIPQYLGKTIKAWTYKPKVDINNDGKSDDIVVWNGYGTPGSPLQGCGFRGNKGYPSRASQLPFFVDSKSNRIDVFNTIKTFKHPLLGYRFYDKATKKTIYSKKFRPIGTSIGIFQFDGKYYFDTFFDSWGDFNGARRKDSEISFTLGVFLNNNGKTEQVCEYHWDNHPEW